MSKTKGSNKPQASSKNPFQIPGLDAFGVGGMDPFKIDIDMDMDVDTNDIDDDELEKELYAIESNKHPRLNKTVESRKPVQPPKKPLLVPKSLIVHFACLFEAIVTNLMHYILEGLECDQFGQAVEY
jgi:hypothetical protein